MSAPRPRVVSCEDSTHAQGGHERRHDVPHRVRLLPWGALLHASVSRGRGALHGLGLRKRRPSGLGLGPVGFRVGARHRARAARGAHALVELGDLLRVPELPCSPAHEHEQM